MNIDGCGVRTHAFSEWRLEPPRQGRPRRQYPHGGPVALTAVGFEPTPFRNGALSHRLRPLGQTVLLRGKARRQAVARSALAR